MTDDTPPQRTFLTVMQNGVYWKCILFLICAIAPVLLMEYYTVQMGFPVLPSSVVARLMMVMVMLYLICQADVMPLINQWRFDRWALVGIAILGVPILYALAIYGIKPSNLFTPLEFIAFQQAVGFYEEIMFRGILFLALIYAFMKSGVERPLNRAIGVLMIFFATPHLISLADNMPIWQVAIQFVTTALVTYTLCMVVVMSRNIWVVCVLHGLNNVTVIGAPLAWSGLSNDMTELIVVILMGSAIYILHHPDDEHRFEADLRALTN